jgi:hypothetical protein
MLKAMLPIGAAHDLSIMYSQRKNSVQGRRVPNARTPPSRRERSLSEPLSPMKIVRRGREPFLASGDAFAGVSQVCGYHLGRPVGPWSIILTPRVKSIAKEEPL